MRISDWSSDVCSSDLEMMPRGRVDELHRDPHPAAGASQAALQKVADAEIAPRLLRVRLAPLEPDGGVQIGRASGRERGCQYVSISVVAVSLKQQKHNTMTHSIA